MQEVPTAKLVDQPVTPFPWWLLPIGLLLAAACLPFDQSVIALFSPGEKFHALVLQPTMIITGLGAASAFLVPMIFMPTWRGRFVTLCTFMLLLAFAFCSPYLPEAVTKNVVAKVVGNALPWVLVLVVFLQFKNGPRMLLGFIIPSILAAMITHAAKWSIGRARPKADLGSWHFTPFHDGNGNFESFPSGHSSAVACVCVVLAIFFPKTRWLFFFFMLMAGFERIVNDKHYPSDVLTGFVVGAFAAWICARKMGVAFYSRDLSAKMQTRPT